MEAATVVSRKDFYLTRRRPWSAFVSASVAHDPDEKGMLPLREDLNSVAVIGPDGDDAEGQLGGYLPATAFPTLRIQASSSSVMGPRRRASIAWSICSAFAGPAM